jgi:hypothetical protein
MIPERGGYVTAEEAIAATQSAKRFSRKGFTTSINEAKKSGWYAGFRGSRTRYLVHADGSVEAYTPKTRR